MPAPGYRNPNSGELVNVGSNGNYWSGTPSGTNGYGFNFNPTDVNPSNAGCNRADARLVRCLQASARVPGSFLQISFAVAPTNLVRVDKIVCEKLYFRASGQAESQRANSRIPTSVFGPQPLRAAGRKTRAVRFGLRWLRAESR